MKLTVLVDNNTFDLPPPYKYGQSAVCYFVEVKDISLFFDLGYSDIFKKNAKMMKLDFSKLKYVVFSHGHGDHTLGINYLNPEKRLTIISHPDALKRKVIPGRGDIGIDISKEDLEKKFELKTTKKPFWITEKLVFLSEILRVTDFEPKKSYSKMITSNGVVDDYLLDDTALVYKSKKGLVIITGCSHAGICNIVDYAKKVCNDERIVDIIGGFHLLNPPKEQLKKTCEFLKIQNPTQVHACHCTDLYSKIELSKYVNLKEVGVGLTLEYK